MESGNPMEEKQFRGIHSIRGKSWRGNSSWKQETLPSCAIPTLVDMEKSAIEENHGCYPHRHT